MFWEFFSVLSVEDLPNRNCFGINLVILKYHETFSVSLVGLHSRSHEASILAITLPYIYIDCFAWPPFPAMSQVLLGPEGGGSGLFT